MHLPTVMHMLHCADIVQCSDVCTAHQSRKNILTMQTTYMQAHKLCGCFINKFVLMYCASCLSCPDGVKHLSLELEFI